MTHGPGTAALLTKRRFLPLFVTQFLSALNDNVFKNALVILILYRIAEQTGGNGQVLVTLAAGIFILPFFLFSATAGQIADKYDKARLIRIIKASEIAIMGAAVIGFLRADAALLMAILFAMGAQSTFFGPLKYGILPDHLAEAELIGGNALVEAGTFLAILLGTIIGGILILAPHGIAATSGTVLAFALAGYAASRFIPPTRAAAPELSVDWNIARQTLAIIRTASESRPVLLSILGISWFWLVGATFLSQFPAFAKDVLGGDETVVTTLLVTFSVGIAIGATLCNRLLKGAVSARYVPFAALGITLFAVDLVFASRAAAPADEMVGAAAFLSRPGNWRIIGDLLMIAVCGGVYSIPLYAILQARSDPARRARMIAANNVINALFMVVAAVLTVAMLAAGFSVPQVFLAIAVLNAGAALIVCGLLPDEMLKVLLQLVFRLAYRVEVRGLENMGKAGDRLVIVPNHMSFLDGPLLAAFLPGRPSFAIDTAVARRWWVRPVLALINTVTVDPANPFSTKVMAKAVRDGRHCVIFPEGRITVTGSLMKVYEGPGLIADKAEAMILPIRIDGAQFTPFSRMKGKLRLHWFPKITITLLPPRRLTIDPDLRGRKRRQAMGMELQDLMAEVAFQTADTDRALFRALLGSRTLYGGDTTIVDDVERAPLSYDRFVLASLVLGRRIAGLAAHGERVGVLLPTSRAAAVTFFALQAYGRVPAMMNFSTGTANMRAAARTAELRLLLTSRRFVELGRLQPAIEELGGMVRIVYLEDLRAEIGPGDKIYGLAARRFPRLCGLPALSIPGAAPAVVLFTSGSEGTPKGVVLSHKNILSNCAQLAASVDFNPTDIVFNALPVFHSFGLTGGMLLPILSGIRTLLYPSPLHYRIVPEMVYERNATILFGTDTFLAGYARSAHPYDFYSLRYVFAGAEKVKEETRRVWMEKFGLRILEGYGATETAPVLAVNTPMHFKAGTVGRFLPGIRHRLEPVPGIEAGGRLQVAGPNVMLGYLRAEAPGRLQPPAEGWYDTGDIVDIDAQGFVRIVGRAKRFAKVGGEMVSLAAAEELARETWPDATHGVVALPDPRKGEQLVLATTQPDATAKALLARAKASGLSELMVPKTVLSVEALPLLGTGKTDYVALRDLVERRAAGVSAESAP